MKLLKTAVTIIFVGFLLPYPFNSFSQAITLNDTIEQLELESNSLIFKTKKDNFLPFGQNDIEWRTPENGFKFGVSNNIFWVKIEFNNPTNNPISYSIYAPYHHIRSFKIYQNIGSEVNLISHQGTTQSYSEKEIQTPGYVSKIQFPPGKSNLYLRFKHMNIPLRASVYLVSQKKLDIILNKTNSMFRIWKIILCLAICIAFVIFFFTRHKVFLFYGILNIGITVFIGIEIGAFFHFFDKDSHHVLININNLGNIITILTLPYFLNELTPIKSLRPKLWRLMLILIGILSILWMMDLFFHIRETKLFNWAVWYIMFLDIFVFITQLYLLSIAIIRKYKNAKILFLLYLFYVIITIYEVLLPNMGINQNSIYAYDLLLKISICEVIFFLILISIEMNSIFKDRNKLILNQKELQKQILNAVVTSQEKERNYLGRELHDMIGANMSVVKQNIDKSDTNLVKVIDDTIESVRSLSDGLMTPKVEGDQLKDEIIDLCLLCSSDELKVNYYFHNWKPITSKDNSTHLYRMIQELLQNAIKHSKATEIYIQFIQENGNINILYEDNGLGFDVKKEVKKGKGLLGLQHRANILVAELRFESSEKGTSIEIKFKRD